MGGGAVGEQGGSDGIQRGTKRESGRTERTKKKKRTQREHGRSDQMGRGKKREAEGTWKKEKGNTERKKIGNAEGNID